MARNDALTRCQILLELADELDVHLRCDEVFPAEFAARVYRNLTETGDLVAAARHRDWLHEAATLGNELAIAVLAVLSDDSFWDRDADNG